MNRDKFCVPVYSLTFLRVKQCNAINNILKYPAQNIFPYIVVNITNRYKDISKPTYQVFPVT